MEIEQITPVVSKKVLIPFILITSLFALWGFANDITNPMVSAFKKIMELDNFQASLVQLAFYGGYGTMALPAGHIWPVVCTQQSTSFLGPTGFTSSGQGGYRSRPN